MKTRTIVIIAFLINSINLTGTNYYVDSSVGSSGDGLSWSTAWKTINEAAWSGLLPGDVVWVKAGIYQEYVSIDSDGAEIVGITYDIRVDGNRVYFPAGTDLSGVEISGSNYVYVFRSYRSNNGAFQITGKGENYVEISDSFIEESGEAGNEMMLSAAIGKPIIYRGYTPEVGDETIITGGGSGFYFEKADFNIFENFTIRNSSESFNNQYGGKFNLIINNTVESLIDMNGIQIGASSEMYPNQYNIICNNTIFDPQVEGIYIGAGGQGPANNHTDFTHIIDNEIYSSLGSKELENAIDLKEHNKGSVVEGNYIHDINLMTSGNGAIDIRTEHNNVLIYNNTIKNIHADELYKPVIRTYAAFDVEIFNNIIYNEIYEPGSELFAWICQADADAGIDFYHNTIHNLARGFWMENSAGTFRMHNNIFSNVQGAYLEQWQDFGMLTVKNNIFTSNHNWTPENNATESGSIFSDQIFFTDSANGDFDILENSVAINAGATAVFPELDFSLSPRDMQPDIGAFEYSSSSGTENLRNTHLIQLSPIPAKSVLHYSITQNNEKHSNIKIFNIQGQELLSIPASSTTGTLDISMLSSGIYIFSMGGAKGLFIKD